MKHFNKLSDNEKNNIVILVVQLLNIILVSLIMTIQFFNGERLLPYYVGMTVFAFSQVIMTWVAWLVFKNQDTTRVVVQWGFLVLYIALVMTAKSQLAWIFSIPMLMILALYNDKKLILRYNLIYLILNCLAIWKVSEHNKGITDGVDVLQYSIVIIIAITNTLVAKTVISNNMNKVNMLIEANKNVRDSYNRDYLTGLYNRNYLMNHYDSIFNIDDFPIAIGIININGLKLINEYYGNGMGDHVIKQVGLIISQCIPIEYKAIRMDSDEYMIVMRNTTEKEAIELLDNIKETIRVETPTDFETTVEYGTAIINSEPFKLESCISFAKTTLYQKKMMNKESVKSSLIESLRKSLSESDFETEEHAERTKEVAVQLGKELGLNENEQSQIGLLAILHDIGKMSIPREILTKPGKLNNEEWEIMKTHTTKGYEIAASAQELKPIAKCIKHHHEKWDGTGYPSGLKGEDIPLLSRIITVVDSFDVMTHNRPYHKAMPLSSAKEELIRCSGTQFDPTIVNTFLEMIEESRIELR